MKKEKYKTIHSIRHEKSPTIGLAIGTDHFNYRDGKKKRTFILFLPFVSIHYTITKRPIFNLSKSK